MDGWGGVLFMRCVEAWRERERESERERGQREVESQGERRRRGRGKKQASKRGEVVVLRSGRMSAFPLSGEGDHRLSVSVTPLVYASLRGRGKGR